MTRIIGFGGAQSAGKTSACNYIAGLLLTAFRQTDDFVLSDIGEYMQGGVVRDVNTVAPPLVQTYAFAGTLKNICKEVFGFTDEQVNGDLRSGLSHILWQDVPGCITNKPLYNYLRKSAVRKMELDSNFQGDFNFFYHAPGFMTAREVLIYFGSQVVRRMDEYAWINSCMDRIKRENPMYALVADLRFVNEFAAIKEAGGYCVKLSRGGNDPIYELDQIGDQYWDIVIDNRNMTMAEFKQELIDQLRSLNLLKPESPL